MISNGIRRAWPGLLRSRFQFLLLLTLAWTGIICLRLVHLQVFMEDQYVARANRQRQSVVTLNPERGLILDREGRQLAISIDMDSVYGIPDEMPDPHGIMKSIAAIVPIDVEEVLARSKNKTFVWIARKIPHDDAGRLKKLGLPGVYFTQESRRFYPNKQLASHVIGFVGMDNEGLSGIEYQYDQVIKGVEGKLIALRDAKRRLLFPSANAFEAPTAGRTIQLTIDTAIQNIAERELRAAVEEQHAKGGSVIIMNPYTGEILALANEPTFNPNAYSRFKRSTWKNRAVQDYYEPGSTFKPVVAAAALDQGIVSPDDQFDCQWGSISIAGHVMRDHKPFGILTFREIIEKSSNVGTIKIGLMLGPQTLVETAQIFGFGKKTGIDLPAETPGVLRQPARWSAISIGAVSIGQEIGVSPIQILRMITSIGNGGFLSTPHLVARISDSSGDLQPSVFSQPAALPFKKETVRTLQGFLRGVVDHGSGRLAGIPGYSVAGKTGTAQKIGPSGGYSDGGYVASFSGYVPAEQPAFSMIVVIDGPKKEIYGGRVAAPLFRKIGQQILEYLDVPPDQKPDLPVLIAESAFPRETPSANIFPEGLEPVAYTPPDQHHKPAIVPDDDKASGLVMPYLSGKTLSEVVETLSNKKIPFRVLGTGTVMKQFPNAGTLLSLDDLCIITMGVSNSSSSNPTDLNATRR